MAGCQDYLNQAQGNAYDFNGEDAADNMAQYGYCAGTNAALNLINNSAIVKEIAADIAKGELEATKVIAMLSGSMAMFSEVTGVSLAAASSVMPYVAVAIIVIVAAVTFINDLGPGPQLWVPNPNATGDGILSCSKTMQTQLPMVLEKINLSDYAGFIKNATNWIAVPANAKAALSMSAQEFSDQHNIFLDSSTITTFAQNGLGICDGGGYGDSISAAKNYFAAMDTFAKVAANPKQAPGAYEILRAVQIPAAAALFAAMPLHLGFMTNSKAGCVDSPIAAMFPALKTQDVLSVFKQVTQMQGVGTVKSSYATAISDAGNWINAQCPRPTLQAVVDRYGLPPQDACDLINAWVGPDGCAPNPTPCTIPITQITVPTPFGGNTIIKLPTQDSSNSPTPVVVSATAPVSTTTKVVGAAAAIGVGALLFHVYVKKNSWGSTERAVIGSVKGVYGKARGLLRLGRRANPIDPAAATGGRTAAYRVNLALPSERIALTRKGNAILYRYDQPIAKFRPSKFQKSKIRAGAGEVLIFNDQLE